MRCGELADVQLLCRMREWPEFEEDNDMYIADLPAFAVRCGRLDVIQWLHAENDVTPAPWSGLLLCTATSQKLWDVGRWLMANRPEACTEKTTDAMVDAVGDLEMLHELIAFRPHAVTTAVMDAALYNRQWEAIRYLQDNTPVGCSTRGMDVAAGRGYLDIVEFLHDNRTKGCTTKAMDEAAGNGHLAVVQFLHENRTEGCTAKAMVDAARCGHLNVVQFLQEHRQECCATKTRDKAADQRVV